MSQPSSSKSHISNELDESSRSQENQNKKNNGKGKDRAEPVVKQAWDSKDDLELCKAWLGTPKDSATGTRLSKDDLWDNISARYHEATKKTRTIPSLLKHWCQIQKQMVQYIDCYSAAKKLSGSNENNLKMDPNIMYIKKYKSPFKFPHCYQVLSVEPKWKEYHQFMVSKKKNAEEKNTAVAEPIKNCVDQHAMGKEAPVAERKRQAEESASEASTMLTKRMAHDMEYDETILAELKKSNIIAEKEYTRNQEKDDLEVLSKSLVGIEDEDYLKYLKYRKAKIWKRIEEEEKKEREEKERELINLI